MKKNERIHKHIDHHELSLIHFSKYVLDVWLCNTNINNPDQKKIRMWGAELIVELIFNKWIAV